MPPLNLSTERLDLIACTRELAAAELNNRAEFSQLLNADLPENWPPPLNDEATMSWTLNLLSVHPDAAGWASWYFLLNSCKSGKRMAVGNGGFRGLPLPDGTVEIGYSIVQDFQGKGYATEAAWRLIGWAFEHTEVTRVIAETYPHIRTSIRVLEKCGFEYVGEGSAMLVIRFELTRAAFEHSNEKSS